MMYDVTVRQVTNGYIVEWYDGDQMATVWSTFQEAVEQLQIIFKIRSEG